ncbi:hypothetical protein YTPLAS72_09550 [Nitrospira sp.]|nr:hypothetical protein YTPLAS72_09550 [Nitrospira sp.]
MEAVFPPDRVRSRSRNRNEAGTDTGPKSVDDVEPLGVKEKRSGSWWKLTCEVAGKRINRPFKLAERDVAFNLEVIADECIGQVARIRPTTELKKCWQVVYMG